MPVAVVRERKNCDPECNQLWPCVKIFICAFTFQMKIKCVRYIIIFMPTALNDFLK